MTLEQYQEKHMTKAQVAKAKAWADAESLKIAFNKMREIADMTQKDVAERMGKPQGEVSKIESRTDLKLSTLRKYVEALGGELEIRVKLGRKLVPVLP